jgi:hypothetical protein
VSDRPVLLRVLLAATQALIGGGVLLPAGLLTGAVSAASLTSLPLSVVVMVLPLIAFPLWVLALGVRSLWPLTPGAVRALRRTQLVVIAWAALLSLSGALMLQAAERSAARGGGLLGGVGLLPLGLGIAVGVLALVALLLLRALGRSERRRRGDLE